MTEQANIVEAADLVRRLGEKHGIQQSFRFLAFTLSLLPIPVIQQAGQVLDRHLGDKAFREEIDNLWAAVNAANANAATVASLEAAIVEIAKAVSQHEELLERSEQFSTVLSSADTSFTMETQGASYQEIVDSIIQAGRVFILATDRSVNVVESTEVHSPHTHLHASGGSKNYFDSTSFKGPKGAVGMHGISTKGNVRVTDSSVGLGDGGALIFGGNPNTISGDCPICRKRLEVDKRKLVGHSQIQCPHCNSVLPFSVG